MKYRKKPVVIEAYQLGSGQPVPDWFMDALTANVIITHANEENRSPFDTSENFKITASIKTLKGDRLASNHDFIIRGAHGELYPCKPGIFEKTFEVVEGTNIFVPIYRNKHGWFTCQISKTEKCQFLGFRKFGQIPVCMKGNQSDLDYYNGDPLAFIEPKCGLAEKHLTT